MSNAWAVSSCVEDHIHIVPLNDLRDHELSITCWCYPTVDDNPTNLIIHHSMDKREEYESGKRRPS